MNARSFRSLELAYFDAAYEKIFSDILGFWGYKSIELGNSHPQLVPGNVTPL